MEKMELPAYVDGRIIVPASEFTEMSEFLINAQDHCDMLVNKFYMSMAAARSTEKQKIQDMFVDQSCDDFADLIKANVSFRCFNEKMTEMLDKAADIFIRHPEGLDKDASTELTEIQFGLFEYLLDNF